MKKIVLIMFLVTASLFAKSVVTSDYQMHSNVYNENFNIQGASVKEVFFGTQSDYYEKLKDGLKEINIKGLDKGLEVAYSQSGNLAKGFLSGVGENVLAGAGIGAAFALIDYMIKESKKAKVYMYVVEFTDKNGNTTGGSVLLSSKNKEFKDGDDLNKIKNIMKKGF